MMFPRRPLIAHDEYGVPLMMLCLKLSKANISETGYRHTHETSTSLGNGSTLPLYVMRRQLLCWAL